MHSVSLHGEGMRSGGGGPPRHPYAALPLLSKDLWVILWLSLHSMCLNSCTGEEILSTCIYACRHVPSTEALTNTYEPAHAHTHFIHWLGHQIYAPFPGRKTLLSHRHCSLGFHSAIWCLAKASFVTDCVLKLLYDQNLCGPEEFEILCGKKDCGGVHCVCISVCARTTVCSAEGPLLSAEPLQVVNTPWHRIPQ